MNLLSDPDLFFLIIFFFNIQDIDTKRCCQTCKSAVSTGISGSNKSQYKENCYGKSKITTGGNSWK